MKNRLNEKKEGLLGMRRKGRERERERTVSDMKISRLNIRLGASSLITSSYRIS